MAELKTKQNSASVADFLNAISDEQIRQDCWTIVEIMQTASKSQPQMWGDSIVGFGSYHYVYKSGHSGDAPLISFSPRKQNITLYGLLWQQQDELLAKLGKHSLGKGCLYLKRLTDVDLPTLKQLVHFSFEQQIKTNPPKD